MLSKWFKTIFVIVLTLTLVGTASATTTVATSTSSVLSQLESLLSQIRSLQTQVEQLKAQQSGLAQELRSTLALTKDLREGMTSGEVKRLQEILATDPSLYPERLVTGYFGKLTAKALRQFQKREGIEENGTVGTTTRSRINQLLLQGAGNSGKVPPGLLIAKGIQKKLGFIPVAPAGQKLPPGIAKKLGKNSTATTTPDTTAPVISEVAATSTSATSTTVSWKTNESATSQVWFGTSAPLDSGSSTVRTATSTTLTKNHSLTLTGLTASTTYYYLVGSADAANNAATSSQKSFLTPAE